MDFLQLPTCTETDGQEFDYALVVVCRLSGYVLAIPCLKRGLTAEKVARMFLRHVVTTFGLPHEIMSDNDHLINSKFMNTVCAMSGVIQHTSIIYRPRGNGRAETGVRLVIEVLQRILAEGSPSWIERLPREMSTLNGLQGLMGRIRHISSSLVANPLGWVTVQPFAMAEPLCLRSRGCRKPQTFVKQFRSV